MSLLRKRQHRGIPEIPLASMADISFLLLIFFLVSTSIDVDTGIGMTLPPKLEEDQPPPPVRERNLLKILVTAQGEVLVEDQPSGMDQIRAEVRRHLTNDGRDPDYAESVDRAVISLKTNRQTPYDLYVQVLDEVWLAYFERWDQEARAMGYPGYEAYKLSLKDDADNVIREKIKAQISIAEPE